MSDFNNKTMEKDKLNAMFKASGYSNLPMVELKNCNEARKRQFQSIDAQSPLQQKPAEDIIKEIAILEMEVKNLEKHLLSKYRNTFAKTASSYTSMDIISKTTAASLECNCTKLSVKESSNGDSMSSRLPRVLIDNPDHKCNGVSRAQPLLDSSIQYRSHSSLSQSAACAYKISPPRATNAEAMHSFHSLPLSMLERIQDASSVSLAEHLATHMSSDHVRETPNRLSEEMVKCITAIYCQLSDPPLFNHALPTSPISFSSSTSESPPQVQYNRSPQHRENSSFSNWFSNPFHVEDSKELSGSYFTMIEIHGICRDTSKLRSVEHMLQKFRCLVSQLEEIDPGKLNHEEKLAFWINVHNVLVMHVFLVNGIPQGNLKRTSLLLKAAYNIGGRTISVDMIQSSILQCRMPRPGQWFQSLFFPKSKFKAGDARKAYAIGSPQPLLKFALTSGNYSDPMVRIYTPKRLFQELEMAKEEYIQTTCKIQNERKICLPKIVDSYAKELGLCSSSLFKMVEHSTSYYMLQKSFHQPHQENKLSKRIEWIPHNFTFRYSFASELAR